MLKIPTVARAKIERSSEVPARDEGAVGTGEVGRVPIMREPAWMRCLALLKIAQSQAISRHPQRLVSARLAERACWTPSGPAKIKEAAHMMVKGSKGVTAAITREGKQPGSLQEKPGSE